MFRRAFASRVFPADVIEKLGMQHVKGVLGWCRMVVVIVVVCCCTVVVVLMVVCWIKVVVLIVVVCWFRMVVVLMVVMVLRVFGCGGKGMSCVQGVV